MPTIYQLPSANTVSASDLIPISQGGSAHSVSVGALLAQTQPAILVGPPTLLGRFSIGLGGPDTIALGDGLALNNGTLSSASFNLGALPLQSSLDPGDQIVVTNAGTSQLVGLSQFRDLFTAGLNITIDGSGVISSFASGSSTQTYSLTALSSVNAISSDDLVGISQNGSDHTIPYVDLIDGLTIDIANAAKPASDSDTFWVGQTNNVMLRQTLSAVWTWVCGKMQSWKPPVTEFTTGTTLDCILHNNAIIVCSNPVVISAPAASLGSGFRCNLINVSSGSVTFSSNVLTSNGSSGLSPSQSAAVQCVTYSGGTIVFASIGAGSLAISAPGQVTGLSVSSISSSNVILAWLAPTSGGAVAMYSIQFRPTGSSSWSLSGQTNGSQTFTVNGLSATTSYDFSIVAANSVGVGPASVSITVSTVAAGFVPGVPIGVTATNITAVGLTCSWSAPLVTAPAVVYLVQYRMVGQLTWTSAFSNLSVTTVNILNLAPSTSYNIQVTASAAGNAGSPSPAITIQTIPAVGLVSNITWSLVPTGSFAPGAGAIGVNAHVSPATAPIQFGFSTSATIPPSSWTAAVYVNSDLWGQYLPTPTIGGSWYGWAEGTDGSSPTAYATPFTVT